MKIFLLCLLFVGCNAGFLDSLQGAHTNIKEKLASKVSAILSPLVGEKLGYILGHKVVEVAEGAVLDFIGKREVQHKVTIKEVLSNGVYDTKQVLDNYATELQHFHEQIASLDYLKGDVNIFFADMHHSKVIHDKELDIIVFGIKRTLNCDKKTVFDKDIFSWACVQFTSAVDMLKENFAEVHDSLEEGSNGILEAVNEHFIHLENTLVR